MSSEAKQPELESSVHCLAAGISGKMFQQSEPQGRMIAPNPGHEACVKTTQGAPTGTLVG